MFLRNCWYVVAWSRDLGGKPIGRKVLGEGIAIFRGEDGTLGAVEDHCPHRHVPLSMGRVNGANLECGYHGMTFDCTGKCVSVPSQSFVPPNSTVKAYPVAERHGWIWIWMGDADKADQKLIPDFHELTDAGFRAVGDTTHVQANFQLVVDNLMDLSHVGYVHRTTIGNAAMGQKGRLTTEITDRGVLVRRVVPDVPPPPTYAASGRLPKGKNIDRFQVIEYIAPCFIKIHVGGAEAGTGVLEGRYEHGLHNWVLNAITPETESSSHYYWANSRTFQLEDEKVDALFYDATKEAFSEDTAMFEAQQKILSDCGDSWNIAFKADAGSVQSRRYLDRLLRAETGGNPDEAPPVTERMNDVGA